MNIKFKNQFKQLNSDEIKELVNRCAGQDILEYDIVKNIINNLQNKYFIKYIEDDGYGYWIIEYGWKKDTVSPLAFGNGYFENQIKITPFRLYFESKASTPYSKPQNRKHLEEYMFIYINRKCPEYKNAIKEQTEKFLKFLETPTNSKNDDISK